MDEASSLIERCSAVRRNGDHAGALKLAEKAVEASRDDIESHGVALAALARLRRDEGEHATAIMLYEKSAALARQAADLSALAHCLRHIGDIATEDGDLTRAQHCFDQADDFFTSDGADQLARANFLRSKALLLEKQGRAAKASELWSEARAFYAATGILAGVRESERRLAELRPS